jgi:hypothetical protein
MKTKRMKSVKQWFVPDICLCWTYLTTQQGTPIFMARAVVAGRHLLPVHCRSSGGLVYGVFHPLPRLSEEAHQAYQEHLPKRLLSFPQPLDDKVISFTIQGANISEDDLGKLPWTHELRHDAESVFWLLVWWAIHLRPPNNQTNANAPSQIQQDVFGDLVRVDPAMGKDGREHFLAKLNSGQSWLDPAYQELEPLFLQLAVQLDIDLYWAKLGGFKEMGEPGFLHEAMQRAIINFLVDHQNDPFMQQDSHSLRRRMEPQDRLHAEAECSTSTGKRSHDTMSGESEPEVGRVSYLSSPALVHIIYSCRRQSAQGLLLCGMVNFLVESVGS